MNRRDVLGLGALGLGAATLDGCAIFPWPQQPAPSERDLEKLLARLDATLEKMRTSDVSAARFGIGKIDATSDKEGHDAIGKIVAALHVIGTYRDIPESAHELEHVEKHFAEAMPEAFATITGSRDWIHRKSQDDFAKIDARFKRDPDMPMRIMERFDDLARTFEIPIEQRTYLRTATAQLAWRFRAQGTRAVIDDVVQKWDRATARQGALLGMPQAQASDETLVPPPAPLRVEFRTRATPRSIQQATCSLRPTVFVAGKDRVVDMQWWPENEATCSSGTSGSAIRGTVEMSPDPDVGGQSVVVVRLEPPPDAPPEIIEAMRPAVIDIARELRRRTSASAAPATVVQPAAKPAATMTSSESIMQTAGKTAKWGAILLIPPICFVGVVVLLVALFMVIIAGFMSAAGD